MRIMVVDDHQQILDLIQLSIEGPEYEVLSFSDSRKAAGALKTEKFDGVFADVGMPHLDGFELTKLVRGSRENGRIPVVLITGFNDPAIIQKGFEAGATGFLGKPFGPKELAGLVRAMNGPMLRERRRNSRLPFRVAVACQLDDVEGREFEAVSIDLCDGGMLLQSSAGLEVGQRIKMLFTLPNGAKIENARGLVIRKQSEDCIAVVFVAVLVEDRKAIQSFITAQIHE